MASALEVGLSKTIGFQQMELITEESEAIHLEISKERKTILTEIQKNNAEAKRFVKMKQRPMDLVQSPTQLLFTFF